MKAIPAAGHNKNQVILRTQKANCALLPALHITRTAARAARGLLYGRGNAHVGRVNQQKTPRGCFLSVFCPLYY